MPKYLGERRDFTEAVEKYINISSTKRIESFHISNAMVADRPLAIRS